MFMLVLFLMFIAIGALRSCRAPWAHQHTCLKLRWLANMHPVVVPTQILMAHRNLGFGSFCSKSSS